MIKNKVEIMVISKKTIELLVSKGYNNKDLELIDNCAKNVKCFLCDDNDDDFEEKITHIKAKELIGEYNLATAIIRALYTNSAVRDIEGGSHFIYFERKNIA